MYKNFFLLIFQKTKIKESSRINVVYIKKIDINNIKLIVNFIIFLFRKKIENFLIKGIILY